MDYTGQYKRKLITLEEALSKVKSGFEIAVASGAVEPEGFLSHIHEVDPSIDEVTLFTFLHLRDYKYCENLHGNGRFLDASTFYNSMTRKAHKLGSVTYVPNNLREAIKRFNYRKPDIFIGAATPMDKHGYFCIPLSLTSEREAIEYADTVILEINEQLPRVYGDTAVHISEVDFIYQNSCPVPELRVEEPDEKDMMIGNYIAELIEDGSTIQLGIGRIPNSVARALINKKDLGVHTEMLTDGMVDLYYAGAITNRRKTLHKNKFVGSLVLGTKKLYDFIDDNMGVELKRVSYINDPCIIGQNYKMVSVNTSLEVDLTGQCCSESIGPRQYSGTGGQTDTSIGAQRSIGGKSIIAMYSTAKEDTIPKIVPFLTQGAAVSLTRNDVDYVVTEYGIAPLKGRTIRERVNNLVNIAHPDFRNELRKQAEKNMIW